MILRAPTIQFYPGIATIRCGSRKLCNSTVHSLLQSLLCLCLRVWVLIPLSDLALKAILKHLDQFIQPMHVFVSAG